MAVVGPPSWAYQWFPVSGFIQRASRAGSASPGTWTSFYRTPSQNASVGGHPWSQHLVGLAADHAPASRWFRTAAREAGLVVVNEGTHDHVQGWRAGTLERLLTA